MSATQVIDWAAVVRSGKRLVPTGPAMTVSQARGVVLDLREFSRRAESVVREVTGLGYGLPIGEADVVDRRGWIEATAEGMELLTAPLADVLTEKLAASGKGGKMPGAKALSAAGTQLGAVLAFLSGRVLGQFDPLTGSGPAGPGRLLLVAPNIVRVEREIEADPEDFRMWVCLHESTHRLQFTAVPWLRDYFRNLIAEFGAASDLDPSDTLKRAIKAIRGHEGSFLESIQSPEQLDVFDRMMALMTLLEGHADHVMDAVGQTVVPTVTEIREGFTARRRKTQGPIDRLIRALLGMDMKMAQYIKGAAFVAAVVQAVGMEKFNTVWTSPDTLPTRAETTDPQAWIARVLG